MKVYTTRAQPLSRSCATATKLSWPAGATAGILIVAAACLGVSLTLYHVAGPRDVFADTAP
jgi:Na+/H+-translocating membrane pyrophosphatase